MTTNYHNGKGELSLDSGERGETFSIAKVNTGAESSKEAQGSLAPKHGIQEASSESIVEQRLGQVSDSQGTRPQTLSDVAPAPSERADQPGNISIPNIDENSQLRDRLSSASSIASGWSKHGAEDDFLSNIQRVQQSSQRGEKVSLQTGLLCKACANPNMVRPYFFFVCCLAALLAILSLIGYHSIGFVYATTLFLSTVALIKAWEHPEKGRFWRTFLEFCHLFMVGLAILCIGIRIVVLVMAREWPEFPENCIDDFPNCCRVTFNESCNYGGYAFNLTPPVVSFNGSVSSEAQEEIISTVTNEVFDLVESLFSFPYFGNVVSRSERTIHVEVLTVVLGFVDDVSLSLRQLPVNGSEIETVALFAQSKSRIGYGDIGTNGLRLSQWFEWIESILEK